MRHRSTKVKGQFHAGEGSILARKRERGRRGEGTVWQEKDGSWRGAISLGVRADGTRVRPKTRRCETEDEAWAELDEMIRQWNLGQLPDDADKTTVEQFLTRWLEDSVKQSVRATTFQQYSATCRTHLIPRLGKRQLSKLTPAHIQAMQADMVRDGHSDRVRELAHVILRRALQQALKWGLITRNPADAVDKPRSTAKKMQPLTAEQARQLLDAAAGDRLEALYVLAVTVGMRQGELLALQWQDVDLSAGTIRVSRNLEEVAGKFTVGEPKTAAGRRLIELPSVAVSALREHRKRQLAEGLRGDLVFTNTRGGYIRKSNLRRQMFYPLLERAGLPRIRFHDLRHTCATLHLLAGTPPRVVQEMLGHATIAITLGTYSHVMPGMGRAAADKMDTILGS